MKLRSADAITIIRVAIVLLIAYLVIIKFDPFVLILLLAGAIALDGVDGLLAVNQESKGKVGFRLYFSYAVGKSSEKEKKLIKEIKGRISKNAPWGPRVDVAGDRITEYVMWILFVFLHILPLFVLLLIVIRHSVSDAFMGARGTSSKEASKISKLFYTSNWSRALINLLKFITFSYLILTYVSAYPVYIAYILVAGTVLFIMIRGIAEVYDSMRLMSRRGAVA